MICPSCSKEIVPDAVFCVWCSVFVPSPQDGKKANLFARWFALTIDPLVAVILYFLGVGFVGAMSKNLGIVAAIVLPIVYAIWFLSLFRQGMTPGKQLMGLQVVNCQTGEIPGFGRMFLREIVGRFVSALFFGVGYFWAIFDKNAQAWHDKIAGTVVLRIVSRRAPQGRPASEGQLASAPMAAPAASTASAPVTGTTAPPRLVAGATRPTSRGRRSHGLSRPVSAAHLIWAVPLGLMAGLVVRWALVGGRSQMHAVPRGALAASAVSAADLSWASLDTVVVEIPGTPERFRIPRVNWPYATFGACALDRDASYCFGLLAPDCLLVRGAAICRELHRALVTLDPNLANAEAMMSALRNLVTAEEAFFADSVRYTDRTSQLREWYEATPGVEDPVIRLTSDGWTASVRHGATGRQCAIFVGTTPLAPAVKEGEPRCDGTPEVPRTASRPPVPAVPPVAPDPEGRGQSTFSRPTVKALALDRMLFGRWRGTLIQPERSWAPFGIDLVILSLTEGESAGQGVVNNGDCTYDLLVEKVYAERVVLRTAGVAGPCVNGVAIELRPTAEGALHVRYLRPDGTTWMESSLTRFK